MLISVLALQLSAFGVTAAEAASDVSEEEIESEDTNFAAGTVDGQSYIQEFFGVRLDLDDAWSIADEETMATLRNVAIDSMSTEEVKEALASGSSYMDFYAENAGTFQNINTTITKLPLEEALMFRINAKSLLESALPTVKAELEGIGYKNVSTACNEATLMGKTAPCINTEAYLETDGGDVPMYQEQVYLIEGSYMLCFTVTSYLEDSSQAIIDLIQPLS